MNVSYTYIQLLDHQTNNFLINSKQYIKNIINIIILTLCFLVDYFLVFLFVAISFMYFIVQFLFCFFKVRELSPELQFFIILIRFFKDFVFIIF